jgi:hypothetical protein
VPEEARHLAVVGLAGFGAFPHRKRVGNFTTKKPKKRRVTALPDIPGVPKGEI